MNKTSPTAPWDWQVSAVPVYRLESQLSMSGSAAPSVASVARATRTYLGWCVLVFHGLVVVR
jgi:hypothetical protein